MTEKCSETKIRYLELIQNVITRMANNSFMLKGWAITLVAGIFALASKDANKSFFLIAYIPAVPYWHGPLSLADKNGQCLYCPLFGVYWLLLFIFNSYFGILPKNLFLGRYKSFPYPQQLYKARQVLISWPNYEQS